MKANQHAPDDRPAVRDAARLVKGADDGETMQTTPGMEIAGGIVDGMNGLARGDNMSHVCICQLGWK
jgi:hypothetical protein